MTKTVVGLMENSAEAQSVVRELVDQGFERNTIGLMASDNQDRSSVEAGADNDEVSGALKGVGAGAAFGGVAGLLVGLGALAIPGVGPIIAAGPIAAALAGAGIGAVAGGLIGALTKLGVPEEEAHYYSEGVRRGGTLVTVSTDDDEMAEQAAATMREHGAVDIDERVGQWKDSGWAGAAAGMERAPDRQSTNMRNDEDEQMPVREEGLQIGDRQVERGGGRVYSHVEELGGLATGARGSSQEAWRGSNRTSYNGPERRRDMSGAYMGIDRRIAL